MSSHVANGGIVVWLTLCVGMLFHIMPLPSMVEAWRPDWLLLFMIYWAMALPHRYSILTAWILGVLLDVLLGATLGIRALAFSLVIYVVVFHFQRIRNFTRWQQTLLVGLLICLYHGVVYWVQVIVNGETRFDVNMFLPAISSLLIWWWVFWLLRSIRRSYNIR